MAVFFFFADPVTFYDCQHFITSFQFLVCCTGWRTCRTSCRFIADKWTVLYTLVVAILMLLGISYSIYAKLTDPYQKPYLKLLDGVALSIALMEIFTSMLIFILTMAAALWHAQRHMALLESISVMDQRLMREFGANMNYHKLLRKNIVITMLWLVMYLLSIFLAVESMSHGDFAQVFLGGFSYALITAGPHLTCYVHINCAEMLKIRFRLLQRLLNRDYLLRRFPDKVLRERRMHSAVEMVKSLHMMIPEISTIFMLCVLSTLAHDMTMTTTEVYSIFARSVSTRPSPKMIFFISMCMFAPFYKVFVAPIYCHLSLKEGSKCLEIINHIDVLFPKSKYARDLVASTLYWQMSKKFKYYGGVNILFDKTIMTMVVAVVVNYLMILIQFSMIEDLLTELELQTKAFHDWFGIKSDNLI